MEAGLPIGSFSSEDLRVVDSFRRSKRTAVLTILFSDIVGSTAANELLGETGYTRLRHRHNELFKQIMCAQNAGEIIKEIGDSFLCVFAEPSTAVLRAVEFQSALDKERERFTMNGYILNVRIGIHMGQVAMENSLVPDIFGRHVNRAARIEALAGPGQVLTSQAVYENAIGWTRDEQDLQIASISYGKIRLKGVKEEVEIHCFYPKALGSPKTPEIVTRRRKAKMWAPVLIGLSLVIAGLGYLFFRQIGGTTAGQETVPPKSYYVQFIHDQRTQTSVDIESQIIAQLIPILEPHPIMTETDVRKSYLSKGKMFTALSFKDYEKNPMILRDSLDAAGGFFVQVEQYTPDTVKLQFLNFTINDSADHSWKMTHKKLSMKSMTTDLRYFLLDFFNETDIFKRQGVILNTNDTLIVIRLSPDAVIREGAAISIMRPYAGREGAMKRLTELEQKLAFYKDLPDTSKERNLNRQIEFQREQITESKFGDSNYSIEVKGQIINVFDSTATAVWRSTEKYPEHPQPLDVVVLAH